MIGTWQADFQKGYDLKAQGLVAESVPYFERALKFDRTISVVWSNYGEALSRIGRGHEALFALIECLKLDPRDLPAVSNAAGIYREMGNWPEAEKLWRYGLQLDPDSYPVLFNLACLYMIAEQPANALPLYRKLVTTRPNDIDVHAGYLNAARESGFPAESKAERWRWAALYRKANDQANCPAYQKPWRKGWRYWLGWLDGWCCLPRRDSRVCPNTGWEAYETGYATGMGELFQDWMPDAFIHEPRRVDWSNPHGPRSVR